MSNYSPYLEVLDANRNAIKAQVKSIRYVYDEALDDQSVVVLESDDSNYVDIPAIQEDKAIYIIWGYIGIPESETMRKAYITDSIADFTATGVILTLKCLPKASYLKANSSANVSDDTDLPSFTEEAAKRLGLSLNNELGEGFGVVQTGFSKPAEIVYEKFNNPNDPNDPRNGAIIQRGISAASDSARVRRDYAWKTYGSLPQANRSDAQVIEGMKNNEPLDNLVVSGRDDEVTIKQRNFSQPPVRAYEWRGGKGKLLEFKSGIKNTFNRSKSMLNTSDGWDPSTKTHIKGDVKNTLNGNEVLGESVPVNIEEILQDETDYPGNVQYHGLFEQYETTDEDGNKLQSYIRNSELNGKSKFIFREKKGYVPGKFTKDSYLLEQDVSSRIELKDVIPVRFGKHNSSIEQNPESIAGAVTQDQSDRTKELNKSSAVVLGDPLMVEGKIVRVDGVGRKYSGNWYITKAEHVVDESGWLTILEITRNARGPVDEFILGMKQAAELNKKINNQTQAQDGDFITPSIIAD